MELEIAEIEKLIGIFERSDLQELSLREGDRKLKLSRRCFGEMDFSEDSVIGHVSSADMDTNTGSRAAAGDPRRELSAERGSDAADDEEASGKSGTSLTAPLTGVFHLNADDGSPYAEEGMHVKKGDTVGLMEAMKMMSEIKAPADGTIAEICVKDQDFCEYGKVLMRIRDVS